MDKLDKLISDWGFGSVDEFLDSGTALDSVVPGICMNPDCDYTTGVEPDQYEGWCEICGAGTVKSALILMGVI